MDIRGLNSWFVVADTVRISAEGTRCSDVQPIPAMILVDGHDADTQVNRIGPIWVNSESPGTGIGLKETKPCVEVVVEVGVADGDPIIEQVRVLNRVPRRWPFHEWNVAATGGAIKA